MVTGATLSPRAARSQSAEDKTAAEALYEEGKKLLGSKRFPEACARFEASQKLDPGVGTLLFLADCYESMGRTASAWSTFREAASAAKSAGQTDRERIARERAGKLDGKLFQLTISAPAATPGLQIMRNDVPIKKEVWNVAVPVDPGSYKLTASAPGKVSFSTTVEIPSGAGGRTVEIPALADDPSAPSPTATTSPTAAPTASNTSTSAPTATMSPTASAPPTGAVAAPSGMSGGRTAGLVIGVAGLVGVGVGAAFGGVAMSNFSQVKSLCPNVGCGDQTAVDLSKQTGTLADASTVAFVAGGVLAAGGLVLFLVSGPGASPASPPKAAWISPLAGNGVAGLRAGSEW